MTALDITNTELRSLVEEIINNRLDDLDFESMAEHVVSNALDHSAKTAIKEAIDAITESVVADRINALLDEEIQTNDGFGERRTYSSLDDLVKNTIKKKMDGNWELKVNLQKTIKNRVDAMVNTKMNQVTSKMVDELTGTKLKTS